MSIKESLKGKSLLTLKDFTKEEIVYLLELSSGLKLKKKNNKSNDNKSLNNKNIALIFEKPSTRTRCAFTVACIDEGAHPEYLGKNDIQLGYKESVEDTARVLGRLFDGIEFRGFSQDAVVKLSEYSGVPVWNGLTDAYHPTQVLADLLTVKEKFGKLEGLTMTYLGDGRNNVANSLMIGCAKVGVNFKIISPKELWPEADLVEESKEYAKESKSVITITDKIEDVQDSDVIYTDVWCSMGEEDKAKERIEILKNYQVNKELMSKVHNQDAIFMHCLPAVKGNEVTEEIFESNNSVVFDEAENRMHTIKAVMVATLGDY